MKKLYFLLIVGSVLINIFAKTYAMEGQLAKIKGINNDEQGYDIESKKKTILTVFSPSPQEGTNTKEQTWICIPLEEQQDQEYIKLSLEDLRPVFNTILTLYREESYSPNGKTQSKIPVSMREALQNFSQDFYIRGLRNGK